MIELQITVILEPQFVHRQATHINKLNYDVAYDWYNKNDAFYVKGDKKINSLSEFEFKYIVSNNSS